MKSSIKFLYHVLKDRKTMATILPSNRKFAKECAHAIPAGSVKETILELGAGTGIVTKYLSSRNYKNIFVFELQSSLVKELKKKYRNNPSVHILEKDAFSDWGDVMQQFHVKQFDSICSTLPIVQISDIQMKGLKANIRSYLKTGGFFSSIAIYSKGVWNLQTILHVKRRKRIFYWFFLPFYLYTFVKQ